MADPTFGVIARSSAHVPDPRREAIQRRRRARSLGVSAAPLLRRALATIGPVE